MKDWLESFSKSDHEYDRYYQYDRRHKYIEKHERKEAYKFFQCQ